MKSVLEDSGRYEELKIALNNLNGLVEDVLGNQKAEILKNAKIISFINDIKFQLTILAESQNRFLDDTK